MSWKVVGQKMNLLTDLGQIVLNKLENLAVLFYHLFQHLNICVQHAVTWGAVLYKALLKVMLHMGIANN